MKPSSPIHEKCAHLREILAANAPMLIAYSGGVDSAFLLAQGHQTMGARALGVIADSPSLPRAALAEALALADSLGAKVEVVQTLELSHPGYAANPPNRCYFCKAELFQRLNELAQSRGFKAIAYGENSDDMLHERPGRRAAEEFQIIAPLRDAGLTKSEIRQLSREMNLPTADTPAQPCLSSRIPWGTPVTRDALAMIENGEGHLRALGFRIFRVRHIVESGKGITARVLVAPEELPAATTRLAEIKVGLQHAGYAQVILDPAGYHGPSPSPSHSL